MQGTPTPVPDHGTGWGLLLLFIELYAVVAFLGVGTVAALVVTRFDRRVPRALQYLVVVGLLGALALAGFTVLVAANAGQYDVVALLLLVVFLPLALVGGRRREATEGRVALLGLAAMTWSLPFLVGFGVVAFVGSLGTDVPPVVTGAAAVVVVVGGTVVVDRHSLVPAVGRRRH